MKFEHTKLTGSSMLGLTLPTETEPPDSEPGRMAVHNGHLKSSRQDKWANLPSSGLPVSDKHRVAAGNNHSLAVKSDGSVVAWGHNNDGECDVPVDLRNVVAVAAGNRHSLALKSNGTVVAWGYNSIGQASPPVDLRDVVQIASGTSTSYAIKSDGSVVGWGDDRYGQTDLPEPAMSITKMVAGSAHSIWLYDNGDIHVTCNGHANSLGQARILNAPSGKFIDIGAKGNTSVALREDGRIFAWGLLDHGQASEPYLEGFISVAAGYMHMSAITSNTIKMWGWNGNGNGLNNPPTLSSPPVQIFAGYIHAIVLCKDGSIVAWGDNSLGQCDIPAGLNLNQG